MKILIQVLAWLVLAGYAMSFRYYFHYFREQTTPVAGLARKWLTLTIVVHSIYLVLLSLTLGHLPLGNVNQVLTTLSWVAILVYFSLEVRLQEMIMGVFFIPFVLILHGTSNILLDVERPLATVLTTIFFEFHVVILIAAYAAFAISFIASLMYLLLSREMQSRRLGIFFDRLPSLDLFDRLSNHAVNTGILLISAGILMGVYMGMSVWEGNWALDPKFLAAVISWVIYVSHLLTRQTFGWHGKRAAILSVIGFSWLLFSFIIVNEFLTTFHNFQ
jgi:ABC-type transport system involved in cytochrome c biogenesis permease subunit